MVLTNDDRKNLAKISYYEKINWYTEAVKLHYGQAFGEQALLKNEARKATMHCSTKCYFATLDRESYH